MSTFADIMQTIVADTDEVDPNIVARKAREQVMATGDLDLIAECWRECGNDYARQVFSRFVVKLPNSGPSGTVSGDPSTSALARRLSRVEGHPVFATRVCIAPGDWIALGDMTRTQLRQRAEYLRHKAAGVLRSADAFEGVAGLLKSDKAKVSSLDGDVVARMLAGAGVE